MSDPLDQLHDIVTKQIREAHADGYRLGLGTGIRAIEATRQALLRNGMPHDWNGFGALDRIAGSLREASAEFTTEENA